jgi:hypothetical protein
MRKKFVPFFLIGILGLAFCFLIADMVLAVEIENPLGVDSFEDLIGKIIEFIRNVGIIIAPVFLIFAGFLFMTAGGDPNKINTAKNLILWTLIGVGILLIGSGLISILREILGVEETTFLLPLIV